MEAYCEVAAILEMLRAGLLLVKVNEWIRKLRDGAEPLKLVLAVADGSFVPIVLKTGLEMEDRIMIVHSLSRFLPHNSGAWGVELDVVVSRELFREAIELRLRE